MKPIVDAIPAKGGFGKKREKYKAEHDSEIRQFYAVKRKLDNAGLSGKKLTPKQWQAELDRLMEQYAAETAELKPVYADLKKTAGYSIQSGFGSSRPAAPRATEETGSRALTFGRGVKIS